jgi:type I restriction enzyme S subunit
MSRRLKSLATLVVDQTDAGERSYVALEHVLGGAGSLDPTLELPLQAGINGGMSVVLPGDVLFGKLRPYLAKTWLVDRPAYASTELMALRPIVGVDPRWFAYLVSSRGVVEWATASAEGTKMPRTSWERLASYEVPFVPSREVQRAIADYLDAEMARIDALIAKKQRMIDLVDEQVEARFLQFVLGNALPGRPSPSGFYASIPSGWGETTLRHLGCHVQTGPFGSQLHAEEYVEGEWPVVNPMNIGRGGIESVPTMTVSDEKRVELARHVLQPGDIVFGRRGEMGRAGLVEDRHAGWLCGTGSLRLRINGRLLLPGYLALALRTAPARAYFELASVGSTMDNLNSEIVLAFPCPVPPVEAQRDVIDAVAALEQNGQALRDRAVRQIDLLREHRQALITAAVTGELEIPGVAA